MYDVCVFETISDFLPTFQKPVMSWLTLYFHHKKSLDILNIPLGHVRDVTAEEEDDRDNDEH